MTDPYSDFRAAMVRAGIDYDGAIVADGRWHRCKIGPKDAKLSGAYLLHIDERPAGLIKNFRMSEDPIPWKMDCERSPMTERDLAAWKARIAERERQAVLDQIRKQKDAAIRANKIWHIAKPATDDHPYLARKMVPSHHLRTDTYYRYVDGNTLAINGALFVPMYSGPRSIVSLQAIFPNHDNPLGRDRDFLPGGRKEGCYFRIGTPKYNPVAVCEGYATGASVHQATGWCVMVAMTAGNLLAVSRFVRVALPAVTIVLAGDNDTWTDGNPGERYATAAARDVRGVVVLPEFAQPARGFTDFNDLHQAEGIDAVRRRIINAL